MTENISFTKTNHLESPKLLLTVLLLGSGVFLFPSDSYICDFLDIDFRAFGVISIK